MTSHEYIASDVPDGVTLAAWRAAVATPASRPHRGWRIVSVRHGRRRPRSVPVRAV